MSVKIILLVVSNVNFSGKNQALHFRDEFRKARIIALEDAEGFQEILFALERLGAFLLERTATHGNYEGKIRKLAELSSLAFNCNKIWHSNFNTLYKLVRTARNDALHQGAVARHLTESAAKLTLIIEDAIQKEAQLMIVSDYMIRNPVCASLWQPLSFIRQQMLINSFSFLPFEDEKKKWWFISDYGLAKYFNSKCNCGTLKNRNGKPRCICRENRLAETLVDANSKLNPLAAEKVYSEDEIEEILTKFNSKPILVFDNRKNHNLVGIVTPFDIL